MTHTPLNTRLVLAVAALALACKSSEADTETDSESASTSSTTEGGGTEGTTVGPDLGARILLQTNRAVDVMFVIDNSGSMGDEQQRLAASISTLTDALDALDADYRVAITTSDFGNPRCTQDNFPRTPNQGRFAADSCRNHLDPGDNWFEFAPAMIDASSACTDVCDADVSGALGDGYTSWKPTSVDFDDSQSPRPWVEMIAGQSNLPDAVATTVAALPQNNDADPGNDLSPTAAALRCLLPQGINGCGFESQLESMYLALLRADSSDEINFGFVRDPAVLSINIFSDEADCSYNSDQQVIFLDTMGQYGWSWEPGASSPTSAVCWNAGVTCEGGGPAYSECFAVNKDLSGAQIDDGLAESEAVLQPLARYVIAVNDLEEEKKQIDAGHDILISVLGGVPDGYATGMAEIQYADDPDPDQQILFGIGPGCTDGSSKAIPPVRMREFAEQFAVGGKRNVFSICKSDYSAPLTAIAADIADQLSPACLKICVADGDPDTPVLDPNCVVELVDNVEGDVTELPECVVDENDGAPAPPDGAERCFVYRLDKSELTPSTDDDMSAECIDEGWNLEFQIVSTVPFAPGQLVGAKCELSSDVLQDCPDLVP